VLVLCAVMLYYTLRFVFCQMARRLAHVNAVANGDCIMNVNGESENLDEDEELSNKN
jgi:hypothetical protein